MLFALFRISPKIRKLSFSVALPKLMPDIAEYMTTKEAAEKLGFNVKRIPTMVRKKTLDGIRIGHAWLVSKKSLDEYIEKTHGMSKNDPRRKTQI